MLNTTDQYEVNCVNAKQSNLSASLCSCYFNLIMTYYGFDTISKSGRQHNNDKRDAKKAPR